LNHFIPTESHQVCIHSYDTAMKVDMYTYTEAKLNSAHCSQPTWREHRTIISEHQIKAINHKVTEVKPVNTTARTVTENPSSASVQGSTSQLAGH